MAPSVLFDSARTELLAPYRRQMLPPKGRYFVTHSFGPRSSWVRTAELQLAERALRTGVRGWFDDSRDDPFGPLINFDHRVQADLALALGADAADVALKDTLGRNLQDLLRTFLFLLPPDRRRIALLKSEFPQDRFVATSELRYLGIASEAGLHWIEEEGEDRLLEEERIIAALDDSVGILLISAVHYVTGQRFDLKRLADACHQKGILLLVDLAHAAFITELQLNEWGVDAAAGCSYKWGKSGTYGSVGLFFVNRSLWSRADAELWRSCGWFAVPTEADEGPTRFDMSEWQPTPGALGWSLSTITAPAMVGIHAMMGVYREVGYAPIRAESLAMTGHLIAGLSGMGEDGLWVVTPEEPERRGGEVCIEFASEARARRVLELLQVGGSEIDFRKSPFRPIGGSSSNGMLRVGPDPFVNDRQQIDEFLAAFSDALAATRSD